MITDPKNVFIFIQNHLEYEGNIDVNLKDYKIWHYKRC